MSILLLLIPISLLLLAAAVWAFAWAVRAGQFDDMDTPALDVLRDDPPRAQPATGGVAELVLPAAGDDKYAGDAEPASGDASPAPSASRDDAPAHDAERRSDAD